jgi:hypothetical protein
MNVSKILETYARHAKDGAEFEVRFAISSVVEYKHLMGSIINKGVATAPQRTINIIKDGDGPCSGGGGNWIATMKYVELGGQIVKNGSFSYSCKKKIISMKEDGALPYRLAVSEEMDRDRFDENAFDIIRIKLRQSVLACDDLHGKWRFDMTLTSTTKRMDEIKKRRAKMFPAGMTAANFLTTAPFVYADAYELEAEWIHRTDNPTAADIEAVVGFVGANGGIDYNQTHIYQQVVHKIAKLVYPGKSDRFKKRMGIKKIGRPAIGLSKETYFRDVLPNITSFAATEKADGERILGIFASNKLEILSTKLDTVEIKCPDDAATVYEAELIDGVQYIFGILYFKGTNMIRSHISKIIPYIDMVVKMLNIPTVKAKRHIMLTKNYAAELTAIRAGRYPYELDGIIFTGEKTYKFKDVHTIDCATFPVPRAGVLGIPPHITKPGYSLKFLFVSTSYRNIRNIKKVAGYNTIFRNHTFSDTIPIQFSPPSKPTAYMYYHPNSDDRVVDGNICEYKWVGGKCILERVRHDRSIDLMRGSFGNSQFVANETWKVIQSNFVFDDLKKSGGDIIGSTGSYFSKTKYEYVAANIFNKWVKGLTFKTDEKRGIDLSVGRGADLNNWSLSGVESLLGIDVDAVAIRDLLRKHDGLRRKLRHYKLQVYAHVADLAKPAAPLLKEIKETYPEFSGGVKFMTCHMAIHYFCESAASIANFARIVDGMLDIGGTFTFTCYDGRIIFKELEGLERIDTMDEGVLKYSIVKAYVGRQFSDYGQKIKTLLGFSDGALKMEYLVNVSYITKVFKVLGYSIAKRGAFKDHLEDYSIDNLDSYDKISEADMDHINRYMYVVLKKGVKGLAPFQPPTSATGGIEESVSLVKPKPMLFVAACELKEVGDGGNLIRLSNHALDGFRKGRHINLHSSEGKSADFVVVERHDYKSTKELTAALGGSSDFKISPTMGSCGITTLRMDHIYV